MNKLPGFLAAFLLLSTLFGAQAKQEFPRVPFDRYLLHAEITQVLQTWHRLYPELTRLHAIGRSYLGKELWVLEITNRQTGEAADKPGFWADGGTHPDEPTGTPMVMHTAQRLLLGFKNDPAITVLLDTRVFYIMPTVNPDGTDHWLSKPGIMSHAMPWDNDRDGAEDEDPPEDLNGDGAITLMRVRDESGPLKTSPLDPRLLTVRQEGEKGEFRTYTEGVDNDGDGEFNEDPVGGINVNRNFPYEWNPAQPGAGRHPLSIPESRAIVEFITAHPNIGASYSIHGGAWPINWNIRPPANIPNEQMDEFDLETFEFIGRKYTEITKGEMVEGLYYDTIMKRKPGPYGFGLFTMWMYHDFGAFGFTPEMCGIDADYDGDGKVSEIEMLRWNDTEKGGRYMAAWKPYDHPQLGRVEIGGWIQKIAPIDAGLEKICSQHTEFNLYQASLLPLLRIHRATASKLSGDLYKVEASVANLGFLPTYISRQALANKRDFPIVVSLTLRNCEVVSGKARTILGHLEGNAPQDPGYFLFSGGSAELPAKTLEWLVRKTAAGDAGLTIGARSARAGAASWQVALAP